MGFFDKVTEGIGTVAKKSEEMLNLSKLKSSLSELKKEKDHKTIVLGNRAFELCEQGSINDDAMQQACKGIKEVDEKIIKLEQEIQEAQNPKPAE